MNRHTSLTLLLLFCISHIPLYAASNAPQQSKSQLPSTNNYQQLLTMKSIANASKVYRESAHKKLIEYTLSVSPQFKTYVETYAEHIKRNSHICKNRSDIIKDLVFLIDGLSHQYPTITQLNAEYKKASAFYKKHQKEYSEYAITIENPLKEKNSSSISPIANDAMSTNELFNCELTQQDDL